MNKRKAIIIITALVFILTAFSVWQFKPFRVSAATNVQYIDANGNTQTRASANDLTSGGSTTLNAGWYVASGTVNFTGTLSISGDVHIILANNCVMTVSSGINVLSPNSLTIYAQSGGTGMLNATGFSSQISANGSAAIGGNGNSADPVGNITINGGIITATGGQQSAGIGGGVHSSATGTIIINGGTITANGGAYGAGIGGGDSLSYGNRPGANVTINGGTVTANGGIGGAVSIGAGGSSGTSHGTLTTGSRAVVFASSIGNTNTANWSGIVFQGKQGRTYSNFTVEPLHEFTIPTDYTLRIYNTFSLPSGVTMTNNGTVIPENGSTVSIIGTRNGNKINGANVTAPTEYSKTATSVTLTASALLATTGQSIEYGYNTSNNAANWQDGATFTGLSAGTDYYFFARSKSNTHFNVGAASSGVAITTDYSVTWHEDGGLPLPTQIAVIHNGTITAPDPMTRTGYIFDKWYSNSELTAAVTFPIYNVYENKTFWAKWTECSHTDYNEGTQADCTAAQTCGTCGATAVSIYTTHSKNPADCSDCLRCDTPLTDLCTALPKCVACQTVCGHTNRVTNDCTECYDCGKTGLSVACINVPKCAACQGVCSHTNRNKDNCTKCDDCGATETRICDDTTPCIFHSHTFYTVKVIGGTGSGDYIEGATVYITAETPNGQKFINWTAIPAVIFGNATATTTSFEMPASDVTVTANFENKPEPKPEPIPEPDPTYTYYTVTFDGNGGTPSETSLTVSGGDAIGTLPTATRDEHSFNGWFTESDGGAQISESTIIENDITFYAKWTEESKPQHKSSNTYSFIEGADSTWVKGSPFSLTLISNGDFKKFVELKIDGAVISTDHYTKESGSTKITIKPEYLETLAIGTHTIEFIFNDGTAQTTFTILAATSPKTGDRNNLSLYLWITALSATSIVAVIIARRRRTFRKIEQN